jgi:hypothetical protein
MAAILAIGWSVGSLRRSWDEVDAARATRVVIRRQLDAFNRNDYRAAYEFAAPEIQERFPLPDFRKMVRDGYPQIARSRSAEFGTPEVHGSEAAVPLTVTGKDGVTVRVIYHMRRERGRWRVAGVEDGRPRRTPPGPPRAPEGSADAV